MTKTSLKKFTSIALAVLMILSTFMVGAITASADGTSTVYLKPNANWNKDGARFAVYVFNSTGNAWASMEADSVDGVYRADIPSGSWSSIIFCRMNGQGLCCCGRHLGQRRRLMGILLRFRRLNSHQSDISERRRYTHHR